jgi:hypothetical protein
MHAFYAESFTFHLSGARARDAIVTTIVHFVAILAFYATVSTKDNAQRSLATDVYYAVTRINPTSSVLAHDVFCGITATIAPMTKNGRCIPAIFHGRVISLIAALCVVSGTVIIRDVLALCVTNGTMGTIANRTSCHLPKFQLRSRAHVATFGTALTFVTVALFHYLNHHC